MKGSKKLDSLLEDNKKKLKSYLNMMKKKLWLSQKKIVRKSKISMGLCYFDQKKPVYVGQTGGYSTTYKPINKTYTLN